MTVLSRVSRAAALALPLALFGCVTAPPPPTWTQPFAPIDPFAQTAEMQRGVNVLGYDPVWTNPSEARFAPADFKLIRDAGFSTVRVVLQSFDHMDADDKLDPQWLATLDTMVKAALGDGLTVILDEHDYELCGKDVATCKTKLDAFWSQIAPHFKDAPNRVIFELLNEPHGAMTVDLWNTQLRETLAIVRATNPTRNVIIGPDNWNGLEDLPKLDLPADDQHIIVTFHYYHPMTFTHQGAAWVSEDIQKLSNVPWGSEADHALLNKEFDIVKAWSEAQHRPIFLGEFGAYDKAPMEYRVKWDAAVARAAEARGFAWAYWQFDPDFKLYDFNTQSWVEPILHALIPPDDGTMKPAS
ncbi:MAG: glycoside hydrolase family 5 protein [Alphaproteobacteria bacterium]|nr:glycoside hydrolase family 5 protein [Alphaproteobacteria bacterium]